MIKNINQVVLTLDAGGTNFVFGAMQNGVEIVQPVCLPSNGHDLQLCIKTLFDGFTRVTRLLSSRPSAISFAFPGPADYPNGIIGDLLNLPGFRGGVPLGPMLEDHFDIPVFINNDGDLFAYGEALAGILPEINHALEEAANPKRYKNLIGLTLGTGFGGGIVINNKLLVGDNSLAGEVWIMSNRNLPQSNSEEGISIRAVQYAYARNAADSKARELTPKDIYEIAIGQKAGNRTAAIEAYKMLGHCLGDAVANLLTIFDGIVVIGGGLSGASSLYMPALMDEIENHFFINRKGEKLGRLVQKVYNYDDEKQRQTFLQNHAKKISIRGSTRQINFDPDSRLAIATSRLGASKAISLGAYTYAINNI
jgi:glucokinase